MTYAFFGKTSSTDKCIPLVREITFENAEELTEEGLPFLILFRRNDDENSLEMFKKEVLSQLHDQKSAINCLYADGVKFAHPLHHLGKSENDLPVIAIDSFRCAMVYLYFLSRDTSIQTHVPLPELQRPDSARKTTPIRHGSALGQTAS